MTCAQHTEIEATAFCRECGTPMCPECQHAALGSVYCDAHVPVRPIAAPIAAPAPYTPPPTSAPLYSTPAVSSPYTAPPPVPGNGGQAAPDPSVHPVLALLLGLIPGVGAIYNSQYAKGLVHAVVFGLLVSAIVNSHSDGMIPLLGIMIAAWVFYMAFEAYHTARKRRFGVAVDEFSGEFDFKAGGGRAPAGAILLIGLGFILLLDTTGILSIDEFGKYWPVGLIGLGVYMLYNRLTTGSSAGKDAEAKR